MVLLRLGLPGGCAFRKRVRTPTGEDRWEISPMRVLGRGGMSVVYEVEHEFTRDRLALKVLKGSAASLDPVAVVRFRREARVSALLRSEHVVRVFDADISSELDGAPFLVMDLLRGADLGTLTCRMPQPPQKVITWLRLAHLTSSTRSEWFTAISKWKICILSDSAEGRPVLKVLDFGVAKIPSIEEVRPGLELDPSSELHSTWLRNRRQARRLAQRRTYGPLAFVLFGS